MFFCQRCELPSKHGEKKTMVVVEKREREYFGERVRERADGSTVYAGTVFQGRGFEIVKEHAACPTCAKIPIVTAVQRLANGVPSSAGGGFGGFGVEVV